MMDETPELPKLSGPTLEPLGGRKPEQLVIMCHGVGSDGDDLIGLAPVFSKSSSGCTFRFATCAL